MTDMLEFRHCTFLQQVNIIYLQAAGLNFQNCLFDKGLNVTYCKMQFFTFGRVESPYGINLEAGLISIMSITPITEKTQFSFAGKFLLINNLGIISTSGITIFARKPVINNITLSGYYNVASRLDFNNIINRHIELSDLNNDGKMYFSRLRPVGVKNFLNEPLQKYIKAYSEFEKADYNELQFIMQISARTKTMDLLTGNYPVLKFKDFIEENYYTDFLQYYDDHSAGFTINNSSAGVLELKNIMFERYKLEIINSDLSAIKLINSHIPDVKVKDDYLNYYHVYNDLYTSAGKQNNTKDKVEYYRISQRYLHRYLKYESASEDRNRGSRFSITISNFYSSHGTDWPKACIVTILLALLFFCLYVGSLREIRMDLSSDGVRNFFSLYLPFFPQFINPLHRIDFMQDLSTLGAFSALIDFFSRIAVSIGIFEIVRSFRKHVRQ
jgi:hypothetical protein